MNMTTEPTSVNRARPASIVTMHEPEQADARDQTHPFALGHRGVTSTGAAGHRTVSAIRSMSLGPDARSAGRQPAAIASSTVPAARQPSRTTITHGATATRPTSQSGAHCD